MNNESLFKEIKLELSKVQNYYQTKNYDEVINKSKILIKKYPTVIPFYNAIGLAYKEKGELILSEKFFLKALKISPNDSSVLCNLGLINKIQNNVNEAEDFYKRAIQIDSTNFIALINYGNLRRDLKDNNLAIKLYLEALNIKSNIAEIHINLATTYNSMGDFASCKKHCEILIKNFPTITVADEMLSKIVDYNKEKAHQKIMIQKIENINISLNDQIILHFSIAKSYEDQGNFPKSIYHLNEGNKLKNNTYNNYNIKEDIDFFSKIINEFNIFKEKFKLDNSISNKKFIFIVGLPRSGTTLLHQILSKHPSVYGSGELVFFESPFKDFINNKKIEVSFNHIKLSFLNKLSEIGITEEIIAEKTPENFIWLGFLKFMFPNSKIIHSKRNLKETAFSIYKHLFAKNSYKWSYSKEHLIEFINQYVQIMNFWSQNFKDEIFNNEYHELINNPEKQTKKIFDFCELKWDKKFLDIQNSKNSIDTLSVFQARKPIYKSSLDFYKNYEEFTDLFDKIDFIDKKKAPSN